ncbi:hypothetical protein HYFRA_00003215 [Hymenoscyphus fraxineus]|uniref:Uncharacterized protein n=1 Tax=Hymenoscyphus fraxineus TaxID=746836 RepID=A0A9N9KUT0_9HELO|nr:hypothetical protein HYFRA_00003215 [Hymenoscyphus fraxineus]
MKLISPLLLTVILGVKAWNCESDSVPEKFEAACCDFQVSKNSTGFVGKDCFSASPVDDNPSQFFCLIDDTYPGCCKGLDKGDHTSSCLNVIEEGKRAELI